MTPKEIWNRGNNLLAVAVVALSGFAFSPESVLEPEIPFKIDEILLFWLGVGAIGWYVWGKNKWKHSVVPVLFVWGGLAIKIMAVIVEFKDKEDVGDDFGALILFVLASVLVTFLYLKAKKMIFK
ncbi:MAG TPA: hypothetical protein VLB73_00725 [Patescibacteria group bacterium]|nr:hypothetical protein [Patescibacteria group bacterium]